ncbi:MAG: hypothetical protein L0211_11180 [Planctomycetaceae bacterium]|nr:hypothetical protein [Planctomycetaceae bacterium]
MKTNGVTNLPLWEQFEHAARSRRRSPERLLTDFMREYLETCEDERLFKEISRQAQRSGYKESDAAALVKEVRQAKSKRRGKS